LGYCSTGSVRQATIPPRTRTIDRTEAKMGRSKKKWEIMGPPGKSEIRISKSETNPNRQNLKTQGALFLAWGFRFLGVFRISDLFRISGFEFRISDASSTATAAADRGTRC